MHQLAPVPLAAATAPAAAQGPGVVVMHAGLYRISNQALAFANNFQVSKSVLKKHIFPFLSQASALFSMQLARLDCAKLISDGTVHITY